ncbi:MAG: helix-turn-helix transcriptional regulator [Leptospirales bacterium]|nr:helix-turn-helix transcriptional regulator [Leptospirales bacterium]
MQKIRQKEKPAFGLLLKQWRNLRGKSQLDLALDASVSARHISFIESGRSTPSKEMVVTLATALNVPLREQNVLLTSAGFAPVYHESEFQSESFLESRRVLEWILKKHEPYPAVLLNRCWDIIAANEAAQRFFRFLLANAAADSADAGNVLRVMFKSNLARKYVKNWPSVAAALIARTYREMLGGIHDRGAQQVLLEVLAYPDVPAQMRTPDLSQPLTPFVPILFEKDGQAFTFSSLITTLGTPQDITLQELRIECFYPMNEITEKNMQLLQNDS